MKVVSTVMTWISRMQWSIEAVWLLQIRVARQIMSIDNKRIVYIHLVPSGRTLNKEVLREFRKIFCNKR